MSLRRALRRVSCFNKASIESGPGVQCVHGRAEPRLRHQRHQVAPGAGHCCARPAQASDAVAATLAKIRLTAPRRCRPSKRGKTPASPEPAGYAFWAGGRWQCSAHQSLRPDRSAKASDKPRRSPASGTSDGAHFLCLGTCPMPAPSAPALQAHRNDRPGTTRRGHTPDRGNLSAPLRPMPRRRIQCVAISSTDDDGAGIGGGLPRKKQRSGNAGLSLSLRPLEVGPTIPGTDYPLGTPHAMEHFAVEFNSETPGQAGSPSFLGGKQGRRPLSPCTGMARRVDDLRAHQQAACKRRAGNGRPTHAPEARPRCASTPSAQRCNDRYSRKSLPGWRATGGQRR